ncbi:hypothetical protein V5O48_011952 [Marasmius crinis-equi]|uniref:Uncharacterized protein n=1 Tax=Marasmius crinis-equi TaxID=585013 RepID=A0ABR3F466_9AGAR
MSSYFKGAHSFTSRRGNFSSVKGNQDNTYHAGKDPNTSRHGGQSWPRAEYADAPPEGDDGDVSEGEGGSKGRSDYFTNAYNFDADGGNFASVAGNQSNTSYGLQEEGVKASEPVRQSSKPLKQAASSAQGRHLDARSSMSAPVPQPSRPGGGLGFARDKRPVGQPSSPPPSYEEGVRKQPKKPIKPTGRV